MSATVATQRLSSSALDPVYRASEVIFGLLMAMSFIGSISVATDGREEVRTLLIAALGCNLAWGLVDAVMHLVATKTQKRRNHALLEKLHGGKDAAEGRALLADEMPAPLAASIGEEGLEQLRQKLAAAWRFPRHGHASPAAISAMPSSCSSWWCCRPFRWWCLSC